jgi:predicted dehydrogenase
MSAVVPLNVGIVGCGLIGQKRARALAGAKLTSCSDADPKRAAQLAAQSSGCEAVPTWADLVSRRDVDLVVVATPHDSLAEITTAALKHDKHVLVEKPAARTADELEPVMEEERRSGCRVRVGFNHRYHRAFRKAFEIVRAGSLGPLMFVRARYGHGGRIGYDREWRADRRRSGGGELIDQGVHLVDLARCFLGDFPHVQGFAPTYFWDMEVEDNGFLMLRTAGRQVAFLHASCTEWKNLFSFEVYGKVGKLEISGLGGSYGVERLAWYRMLPEMGPPETEIWEYPMADDSWEQEMAEFLEDIRQDRKPSCGLPDAAAALRVIEAAYRATREA